MLIGNRFCSGMRTNSDIVCVSYMYEIFLIMLGICPVVNLRTGEQNFCEGNIQRDFGLGKSSRIMICYFTCVKSIGTFY